MRARFTIAFAAVLLVALLPMTLAARPPQTAADRSAKEARNAEPKMLLGSWRLNLAKSRYSPGPPLKDETRVYTRGPEGVTGVVTRTHADGRVERFEYIANFGREYMVTGNPEYDAVTLKQIDEYASEAVLSHAGSVYGVARRVMSQDGKSMTITFDRKNADTPVHNVAVYDKQP